MYDGQSEGLQASDERHLASRSCLMSSSKISESGPGTFSDDSSTIPLSQPIDLRRIAPLSKKIRLSWERSRIIASHGPAGQPIFFNLEDAVMKKRFEIFVLSVASLLLVLYICPLHAIKVRYVEDFTTTTYKDTLNTVAEEGGTVWNNEVSTDTHADSYLRCNQVQKPGG